MEPLNPKRIFGDPDDPFFGESPSKRGMCTALVRACRTRGDACPDGRVVSCSADLRWDPRDIDEEIQARMQRADLYHPYISKLLRYQVCVLGM